MTGKKVEIHVGGGFDAIAKRVAAAWHRAERGEEVGEDHVTFVSWSALSAALTPKRFDLLRHLHRHPAPNVASLARALERDYKRVHEDVEALLAAGLLERDEAGLHADYDEIRTVIAM
jgi:predicted transcriptional regulator